MTATKVTASQIEDAFKSCLALLLVPPAVLWAAYVNWKVYGWLAPSVGLPPLSLGVIGLIGVAIGLLRWNPSLEKFDAEKRISPLAATCYAALVRGFALATAWAFHAWGGA